MLRLASENEVKLLTDMSKSAFDSDIEFGSNGIGPTGFDSYDWHAERQKENSLYSFEVEGKVVGGAVLHKDDKKVFVHRIFIDVNQFCKGYGSALMRAIEENYEDVDVFTLDTPEWNCRTNSFYKKCGYVEFGKEHTPNFDLVLYEKRIK